jgi:hypothetical protein
VSAAMRRLFGLVTVMGMVCGGMASPVVVVERQLTTTAMTKLQAIALIREYELTPWCDTWLASLLPVKEKFDPF